ncbi:LLM class flavin-dependent oxidoreductase [Phytopseudomonas punonensis]|uniref:FMN-dependent oxidoreductase, nitrilotriacetate monooxygenase family n=1 Tax=Phytopseudomonas punonensis TaxID=1220495 RepID=A0A1M7KWE0_9GAMM|nr:LLM class flavin-dependent oxidoreductase [Pseudomonas punonensis]SHM69833.1 FMN-dependent oxidoreductase, nitrilotriacetate monooxygenase family [Pseudomonas punonensis]
MMHLALYLEAGTHQGGWRHPHSASTGSVDWPLYKTIARRAEAACLDMLFVADKLSIDDNYGGHFAETVRYRPVVRPEPLTLLSALAAVTDRIGVGGTVSSSYALPYSAARMLANIDHISGGRAAWNLVTSVSDGEARNFGRQQHYGHAERYARAGEFIEVVQKLWDSWGDEALLLDAQQGVFADPDAFHYLHHRGEFFDIKGPINIPRPPQGQPVLIQAGVSEAFLDLAAKNAEVVFVVHPQLERAKAFYRLLKDKARSHGRDPDTLKILPGIVPVVGETHAAALAKDRLLKELIRPEAGLSFMSASMNHDLAQYPQDGPFPDIREAITGSKGRFQYVIEQAIELGLTVGQTGKRYAESLNFFSPVGSPEGVAEQLAEWYRAGACDGFVILPPYLEAQGDLFLEGVVPVLQASGLFRTEYPGQTLRDTLGLARPASRFA